MQSLACWLIMFILLAAPLGGLVAQSLDAEPGASALKELKNHLEWQGAILNAPLPDTVTLPAHPPAWPGLNRFDVRIGLELLAQAQVVVLRSTGDSRRPVWIKSLRGYKKSNGWYGIRLNGQEIDEQTLYLMYGGREVNFQIEP